MLMEAGHLGPDQEAEPVGPVEPAGILGLLVLASPVEAERLRQFDVLAQGIVPRCSQKTARKIALVEHEGLDVRLAVQPEAAISGFDRAQPEIAVHAIGDLAVFVVQRGFEVVESGRIRMPRHDAGEGASSPAGPLSPPADHLTIETSDQLRPARSFELEVDSARGEGGTDPEASAVA